MGNEEKQTVPCTHIVTSTFGDTGDESSQKAFTIAYSHGLLDDQKVQRGVDEHVC